MPNLFKNIPDTLPVELVEELVNNQAVRIERIISDGHASPEDGWYDQTQNEWVLVLSGEGNLEFEDGRKITLGAGDYVNIKAHEKHKVTSTTNSNKTIWLAIFYD